MIDLATETLVTLAQAAKRLPVRRGKKVSPSALWRWVVHGHKGIKLEGLRTPGGWFTSLEALGRFCARLAQEDELARKKAAATVPHDRLHREAEARLEAAGIKVW